MVLFKHSVDLANNKLKENHYLEHFLKQLQIRAIYAISFTNSKCDSESIIKKGIHESFHKRDNV